MSNVGVSVDCGEKRSQEEAFGAFDKLEGGEIYIMMKGA